MRLGPCPPFPTYADSSPGLSHLLPVTAGSLLVSSKVEVLKVGSELFTTQGEAEGRKLLPTCMSLCWD